MKTINWTSVIVAVVLGAALVAIVLSGKEIPAELKVTVVTVGVFLLAILKSALGLDKTDPPKPPEVTP